MATANSEESAVSVRKSLVNFVRGRTGQDIEGTIDDYLVNYLLAMFDPETFDDDFDIEALREMLSAYVPAVNQIEDTELVGWVHDISRVLSREENDAPTISLGSSLVNFKASASSRAKPKKEIGCKTDEPELKSKGKIDETRVDEIAFDALTEMFPHKNALRIRKCLMIANGEVDTAAQLLLQDDGLGKDELVLSSTEMTSPKAQVDEKTLRDQIINRYAYLDVDEDKKEHKPAVPKAEPKKLIRYRDNKVVSVKGERFTLEKKSQDVEN
ncbi:CUE domain-containing protein 2 [Galendromus occidentalis]|uniref:CUE domain-containing protein 2 n=1 Tax=Galendromus occidentalis TaxID=34638 RepID=A0AAJ6QU60_9ACAR|nr:CUE domain-containing protein 2 [Galendromus occidentalis]